jgi:hypothetical protein
MMVLVLCGLALAATRPRLAGVGWALAAGVKWIAVALLPLELLGRTRHEALRALLGFSAGAAAIAVLAWLLFKTAWLAALAPFAHMTAGWAIPLRLAGAGLPGWLALLPLLLALPWLVRSSRAGRPRLAVATGLLLVASPWLLPWYAVWAVPLAAVEEDRVGWALTLALCAYLLPDRIPL